jgi:hypothetical protein
MKPITCAPDCDHFEYDPKCDEEASCEGSGDGDDY